LTPPREPVSEAIPGRPTSRAHSPAPTPAATAATRPINQIGAAGAQALSEALKSNAALTTLQEVARALPELDAGIATGLILEEGAVAMLARAQAAGLSAFRRQRRGTATLIDGRRLSDEVLREVAGGVRELQQLHGAEAGAPTLAVVLVGAREDSARYVAMKKKAAAAVGFRSLERVLPAASTQDEVIATVRGLADNAAVDGVLVQLPLPAHIDQARVLESVPATKDVDGFHPLNMGRLARAGEDLRHDGRAFAVQDTRNFSCTPLGALALLDRSGFPVAGKHAVVLGRSNIVGLPVALMLLHRHATVTIAHSHTPDLPQVCRQADILVAAIGRAELVRGSWIKPGAVCIDVGINFKAGPDAKARMCGDIAFQEAREVAGAITPVPGGVGPMTVAMLMMNCLNNARARLAVARSSQRETLPPPPLDASWDGDGALSGVADWKFGQRSATDLERDAWASR
jgi:5,10-methylene-tetrahydrofolate dehydrogenase/methenyl tetrahydrofolate cyclohydrolase